MHLILPVYPSNVVSLSGQKQFELETIQVPLVSTLHPSGLRQAFFMSGFITSRSGPANEVYPSKSRKFLHVSRATLQPFGSTTLTFSDPEGQLSGKLLTGRYEETSLGSSYDNPPPSDVGSNTLGRVLVRTPFHPTLKNVWSMLTPVVRGSPKLEELKIVHI